VSGAKDRNRGAETERLLVKGLRGLGFPHADRTIRTGHGTARADLGDVDGTPGLVWQVKSMRPASRAEAAVPGWLAETEAQREAAGASLGILVVRREQHLAPRWWAFVPVVDLYGLAHGFTSNGGPLAFEGVDRDTLVRWPARFELEHLTRLVRGYGFGTPLDDTPEALRALAAAHRRDGFHDAARTLDARAAALEAP
jgi:hypothetical protein